MVYPIKRGRPRRGSQVWCNTLALLFSLLVGAEAAASELMTGYPTTFAEVRDQYMGETLEKTWAPMRDGVRLDTNIFLPKNHDAPYSTVLFRSPYLPEAILASLSKSRWLPLLLDHGYAVVFQSERGRYWSEGDYAYLANAHNDGYDTVEWLSHQAWSNGKVGTLGCSSSAENQLGLSVANHPAHRAAIAQAPGAGIGVIGPYVEQGNIYRGGALHLLFPAWFHSFIFQSGKLRPQFPADLTREQRIRANKVFNLQPNWEWGQSPADVDYKQFFHHLPVSEMSASLGGPVTPWDEFARMTPLDPKWREVEFVNEGDRFGAPMLWVFSWYDATVAPNIALYNYARKHTASQRARGNQFMVVSPLTHCRFGRETANTIVGERNLGDARFDYARLYLDWFDYWLKDSDNKVVERPKVQYYLMGKNQWVSGDQFPLEETRKLALHLRSGGGANSRYGDGELSLLGADVEDNPDSFVYDPLHPVPSLGGGDCCAGVDAGSFDQSELEIRHDILVYTSPVLEKGINAAGFVEIELFVSSDARDTDFTVKLLDVYPDGRAYNLDESIMRARYREGFDKPVLMDAQGIYKLTFAPLVTANYFKPGHRIRLEISSSSFPRYERNLNTGGNNFDETVPVVARNRIHHSKAYPSLIRLPVVPEQ